jgi:DNA-directed RNA polymerase specialized sigma24 family protein
VLANDLDEFAREQIDETAVSEAAQTPESALISKAEAEGVRKAVASLPAHFREVLVLREIHDLNYRTIAEVVGHPHWYGDVPACPRAAALDRSH